MNRLDQELINGCLQGNERAWEDFVHCHTRRIYALSYRFTRCRTEAEDVTQEVFIRVYLTLSSYRAKSSSLSGWVHHIARNLLTDRYRRARRRDQFCAMLELDPTINGPHPQDPLQYFARREAAHRVHAALQRISPKIRSVMVLHYLKGLALEEVAAALHLPVGTVKSRMTRGRQELARMLRPPEDRQPGFARPGPAVACRAMEECRPNASAARDAGSDIPDDPPVWRMDLYGRRTSGGEFPPSVSSAWKQELRRIV